MLKIIIAIVVIWIIAGAIYEVHNGGENIEAFANPMKTMIHNFGREIHYLWTGDEGGKFGKVIVIGIPIIIILIILKLLF